MKKIKDKEREKYLKDCEYMGIGQRCRGTLNDFNYEIGRNEKGYLYANVILEDDKEIYKNTLELLNVHKGITYNKIHDKKRVIGFDCNCEYDYIPHTKENKKNGEILRFKIC